MEGTVVSNVVILVVLTQDKADEMQLTLKEHYDHTEMIVMK